MLRSRDLRKYIKTVLGALVFSVNLAIAGSCLAEQKIPILMYHQIVNSSRDLRLSPETFQRHLDFIINYNYTTITFKDIARGIQVMKPIILTFDDGAISHWYAYEELRKRKMVGVFFPIWHSMDGRNYLKPRQIQAMSEGGMEIGSHGIRHLNLKTASLPKIIEEIKDSKTMFEGLLNSSVITFCIPYGRYDSRVLQILEESRYRYARTTDEGISTFGRERNFKLKIVYIHNWTRDLGKAIDQASRIK